MANIKSVLVLRLDPSCPQERQCEFYELERKCKYSIPKNIIMKPIMLYNLILLTRSKTKEKAFKVLLGGAYISADLTERYLLVHEKLVAHIYTLSA